jgi:hypothetical protein
LESHVKSVGRPCKKQGVEEGKTHTKGMIELYLSKVWDNSHSLDVINLTT